MPKIWYPTLSIKEINCLIKTCKVVVVEECDNEFIEVLRNLFDPEDKVFDSGNELMLGFWEDNGHGESIPNVLYSFTKDELMEGQLMKDGTTLKVGAPEEEVLLTFMMPVKLSE